MPDQGALSSHSFRTACSEAGTGLFFLSLTELLVLVPQDFQEQYWLTGPGQLLGDSRQRFLRAHEPMSAHCNHSIRYDSAHGPQPQLVQHLHTSRVRSTFEPDTEALRFQLTTAMQAGMTRLPGTLRFDLPSCVCPL